MPDPLAGANCRNADFRWANFDGCTVDIDTIFEGADFRGVDMSGWTVYKEDYEEDYEEDYDDEDLHNWRKVDFRGANFRPKYENSRSRFIDIDLRESRFEGAILHGVTFKADFRGASFEGVDFT